MLQALRDECLRGAKYLSRLLEALGCEVKMAQPYEGKNPVVLGRLGHNPAFPTVAFYGHYDVQVGGCFRGAGPVSMLWRCGWASKHAAYLLPATPRNSTQPL